MDAWDLARRVEHAELSVWCDVIRGLARLRPEGGAEARACGGGWLLNTGDAELPLNVWALAGVDGPLSEQDVAEAETFYRDRGREPRADVNLWLNPEAMPPLLARGWEVNLHFAFFARALERAEAGPPEGVVVEHVSGSEALERYLHHAAQLHFERSVESPEDLDVGRAFAEVEGHEGFVALVEGEVAATAILYMRDDLALLHAAATYPEYRRRGIQSALMRARMNWGLEHGARWTAVGTELGGPTQRNALRRGFRPLSVRTHMVQPGE